MGKIRVTNNIEFKNEVVDLYLKEGMRYSN
ncbi:hypothetical protein BTTOUR_13350 [Bacillus thuringiensis serovar toumanoffi]|uniref:Transposase n=1 Tax=Bacillus thuringiensis serovar toumanoffi TaxID=180862 RepID=A0ABD5HY61_BACTU|nr:hypothetical protein [Bacillus thuringiensis serovar toumanoffi]SMD39576.1 hypothetical protein SAMN06272738_4151 [Bacillus sp. JKS001846]